ncbi:hypothetical protein WH47_09486 [Habropoda laboriosa]|uniref:Uncharacterized protein n=1 Tax=Habropoda laboriosa TaxID=597456 RepID=A0A0L7RDN4_9HYME|nr:hypothetical protein WH47_09486 [Habropoda laboriosa]
MANWQMEVARMTSYILFPIGIYYWFNYTESTQIWINNEKKKFNVMNEVERNEFVQFIENFNNKHQMKQLSAMEVQYKMKI